MGGEVLRNADLQVLLSTVLIVREISTKILTTMQVYGYKTIFTTVPFMSLAFMTFAIGCMDKTIWADMPRTSGHLFSFLFCEMVVDLMLSHVTKSPFQIRRWSLIPLFVLLLLLLLPQGLSITTTGISSFSTKDYLIIYASAGWTCLAVRTI